MSTQSLVAKINRKQFFYLAFLSLLLFWKLSLFIWLPYPNGDGPWSLGHTFSIIQGEFFKNTFAQSFVNFYNFPYMYGLLNVPFFYFNFFDYYQIFLWNLILVLILIWQIRVYFRRKGKDFEFVAFLFSFAVLSSPYTFNQRPEIFILNFIIYLVSYFDNNSAPFNKVSVFIVSLLTCIIGLTHPVAGVFTVVLICLMAYEKNAQFSFYVTYLIMVSCLLAILYGPMVLYDFESFYLNFFQRGYGKNERELQLLLLPKYFIYSLFLFLLFILVFYKSFQKGKIVKEIIYFSICVLALLIFSRSYYFPYLFALLMWRLGQIGKAIPFINRIFKRTWIVVFVFLSALFSSHIWPTIQLFENKEYSVHWKNILNRADLVYKNEDPNKRIWASPFLGGVSLWYRNARLHFRFYGTYVGYLPKTEKEEIFLVENEETLKYVLSLLEGKQIEIVEVIKPTKGLIKLGYPLTRSSSVGLWILTLK